MVIVIHFKEVFIIYLAAIRKSCCGFIIDWKHRTIEHDGHIYPVNCNTLYGKCDTCGKEFVAVPTAYKLYDVEL